MKMENNLYRIELLAHQNLPKFNCTGMLYTNNGFAFVKLHPVTINAKPKEKKAHGHWIVGLDGSYMCSKCSQVFRYEIGNYCSNCGERLEYNEEF